MEESRAEDSVESKASSDLSNVKYSSEGLEEQRAMDARTDSEADPGSQNLSGGAGAPSVVLVGTSFRTAGIAMREQIARRLAKVESDLQSGVGGISEISVLATCNRLEVYLACTEPEEASKSVIARLREPGAPSDGFYAKSGSDAIRHLFRVASGLDSVVIGEEQILQQVREAGRTARTSGQAKSILSSLFDAAYSSGRRVRESYGAASADRSVSSFALKRALKELGRRPARVLLIGSGETAKLAALRLKKSKVYLLSGRRNVSDRFPNATRIPRRMLREVSSRCDLIIAATRRSGYVLTSRELQDRRRTVVLDLGFPRNVDPTLKNSRRVRLYDLDDIAAWAGSGRRANLAAAEKIAEEETKKFTSWLTASRLTPTLANIFKWAERVREEETIAALRKLPELSPHERSIVEAMSKRLTGKLLSPHATFAKQVGDGGDQSERLLLLESIFRDESN